MKNLYLLTQELSSQNPGNARLRVYLPHAIGSEVIYEL